MIINQVIRETDEGFNERIIYGNFVTISALFPILMSCHKLAKTAMVTNYTPHTQNPPLDETTTASAYQYNTSTSRKELYYNMTVRRTHQMKDHQGSNKKVYLPSS